MPYAYPRQDKTRQDKTRQTDYGFLKFVFVKLLLSFPRRRESNHRTHGRNWIPIFMGMTMFFLFLLSPQKAFAATATWTNTGADGLWSTCANWSGGTGTGGCPGSSDIATFNSTSVTKIAADFFANSIKNIVK